MPTEQAMLIVFLSLASLAVAIWILKQAWPVFKVLIILAILWVGIEWSNHEAPQWPTTERVSAMYQTIVDTIKAHTTKE